MRRPMVAAVLSLALIIAACGGDDGDSSDPSSSSRSSTSTSTTTTTRPCRFDGTVQPQENELFPVDQLLTDVTTGTDGCVDTITFTFRPNPAPAPSYQIEYAEGPFQNSAGEIMTPAGTVFLRVRFQPSWIADLSVESAPATYTGPRVITPTGLKSVRGLALFDASEAVVGWAIGLDEQRPYAVEASSAKVVITIG